MAVHNPDKENDAFFIGGSVCQFYGDLERGQWELDSESDFSIRSPQLDAPVIAQNLSWLPFRWNNKTVLWPHFHGEPLTYSEE